MSNTCTSCGNPIQEETRPCSDCDIWSMAPDAFLPDGTPVYLKTYTKSEYGSLQMALYDLLMKGNAK